MGDGRRALRNLCIAVMMICAACDSRSATTATPTWTFPPSPTPLIPRLPTVDLTQPPGVSNPTAAAMPRDAAVPFAVEIPANDGLRLRGLFYAPAGVAPGVLLLHMLDHDKDDWNLLAPALQQAGFAVLAVDLRGHGATGGAPDWVLAQNDTAVLLAWLRARPDVNPERVAAVGASIGANLALIGCAADAWCRTAVLLSPGLDYQGVRTEPALAIDRLGVRPVLLAASEDDAYALASARRLAGLAQGAHRLQVYQSAGHGIEMFNTEPGLQDLIVSWLLEHLAQ
ncbi:MAG: alpha/beta fold hydrolase [Anaerolineae bacterium]|nr:alpha/beta fold hydrolase [Anaerolineae bacterium]